MRLGIAVDANRRVLEIYAQLSFLDEEFPRWRQLLTDPSVLNDRNTYVLLSGTMLGIIDPVMRNMMWLWVNILHEIGAQSLFPEIQAVSRTISGLLAQGRVLQTTYKSSRLSTSASSLTEKDVIICWRNDWPNSPIEIVELETLAALHETWVPAAAPLHPLETGIGSS